MSDPTELHWYKSSRSGGDGGNCVEVADNLPGIVCVRDSKDRDGPMLTFAHEQWRTFIAGAKVGEFNQ